MKKIIIIAGVVLLLGGLVAGAFLFGKKSGGGAEAPKAEASTAEEIASDANKEGSTEGAHGAAPAGEGGEGKAEGAHGAAPAGDGKTAGKPSKRELIFSMPKVTVNLQDPSGRLFVQASINLEAGSAEDRTALEDNEVPLRDATIMLLSSKTREEIDSPAAKERLKRELLARFEGLLENPKAIKNIYITDIFVVKQ